MLYCILIYIIIFFKNVLIRISFIGITKRTMKNINCNKRNTFIYYIILPTHDGLVDAPKSSNICITDVKGNVSSLPALSETVENWKDFPDKDETTAGPAIFSYEPAL